MSVKSAHEQFTRISNSRPLGSKTGPSDSASIKRALIHPTGPTGGWNRSTETFVDYSRTAKRDTNQLTYRDGGIMGYVKFDKPGRLQARSYDDYFGDVYCGWSPQKLAVKPTPTHVFVSLTPCAVGDGGLDQVHEVAWFPEGKSEGIIVFSTAHPGGGTPLSASDLYRPELLGNGYDFNDRLAHETITEYLRKGDRESANKVLADSTKALSGIRDSIDGSTGKPIPAALYHKRDWATLLGYELGNCMAEPCFDSALKKYQQAINAPDATSYDECKPHKDMLPIFIWLNKALTTKNVEKLNPADYKRGFSGHDPSVIAQYMSWDGPDQSFKKKYLVGDFWIGVKNYLQKNRVKAKEHFGRFLHQRHSGLSAIELATAAKLAQQ